LNYNDNNYSVLPTFSSKAFMIFIKNYEIEVLKFINARLAFCAKMDVAKFTAQLRVNYLYIQIRFFLCYI